MTKVLVAFGEDGTCGDSAYGPDSCGSYQEGMTFDEASVQFISHLKTSNNMSDCTDEEFADEFGDERPVGFWVVDEKIVEVVNNIDADWGNDSAVYAGISTMKGQISGAADFILEK